MRSHSITVWGASWRITLARWVGWVVLALLTVLLSLGLHLGSPSSLAQEAPAPPTSAEAPAETAAVTLGGEPLFELQSRQAADSVEERAQRVSARLTATANDQAIPVDAIALSETELGTAIYAKDNLIMLVDKNDVAGTDLTPEALAQQYQKIIQRQIPIYRDQRSAEYLSRAALIAFFCTLGLVLAILVLANVMPQFYRWLDRQQDRWVPNVRIQHFQLLTAQQLTGIVRGFTRMLHFALVTALILIYFSYVLSLFPQTHTLGASIFGYFSGAVKIVVDGFIAYLPSHGKSQVQAKQSCESSRRPHFQTHVNKLGLRFELLIIGAELGPECHNQSFVVTVVTVPPVPCSLSSGAAPPTT